MRTAILMAFTCTLSAGGALSAQTTDPLPTLDQPVGTNLRLRLAGDRDRGWLSGTLQAVTYDSLHLALRAGGELRIPRGSVSQFQVGRQLQSAEGFKHGARRGFFQSLFVDAAILGLNLAGTIDGKSTGILLLASTGGLTGYRAWQGLNDPPVVWGDRVQVRR